MNDYLELDAEYYIGKNLIPPLERIFNLVGANVRAWFDEMPKVQRIRSITIPLSKPESGEHSGNAMAGGAAGGGAGGASVKKTLESYMKSSTCIVCRAKLPPVPPHPSIDLNAYAMLPLCQACLIRPARSLLALRDRLWKSETRAKEIDMVCRSCAGLAWGEEIRCDSRDCPVFYSRIRERAKLSALKEGVGRVIEVIEEECWRDDKVVEDVKDGREEESVRVEKEDESAEDIGTEALDW
jgi:DNA polymerase zeta